ncbi:TBC1 domain family member 20 isoform X2 [Orussus abietinus]|uniref:TBC1 domain family member 20 isoform X2 n=1 Tax=Orussus abietinus TaxID=222816 RepID=UPI000625771B|nr:TBC1 domain family member 20 isoform X2 [Orussus abietinus]
MNAGEEDVPVLQSTPGPSVKKLNSPEQQLSKAKNHVGMLEDTKPMMEKGSDALNGTVLGRSDGARAWKDGVVPTIPVLFDQGMLDKQNGILSHEIDSNSPVDDSDDVEEHTSMERLKISVVRGSIIKPDLTLGELKLLGCSSEGFVNVLGLPEEVPPPVQGLETIHTQIPHATYHQILNDVARSGSHISSDASEEEIKRFQNEMIMVICWVLQRHPQLNYYQGYNDIAATILIVMGLQRALHVLERITLNFLERFMEKTMEKVNQELFYIFALLERVHPTLLEHLENVELFPHFALAEYTTWYAHKFAENRKLLHRLFDYFLGSPSLMPLYLSTVIVAHRDTEIFSTTPDMGHTHKVLCTLPDDLPFENLLHAATKLYREYPPESISTDVTDYDNKRRSKEEEWKAKAEASRKEREKQRQLQVALPRRIPYRIRNYKTITVVTILALGLYAFLKTSSALN